MSTTQPISAIERETFEAVRDPSYDNFALLAVTFQGKPTTAIVTITPSEGGTYDIIPVYVGVTPDILDDLRDPFGETPVAEPQVH